MIECLKKCFTLVYSHFYLNQDKTGVTDLQRLTTYNLRLTTYDL